MASKQKKQNTHDSAIEDKVFDVETALRRFIQQSPHYRDIRSMFILPDEIMYIDVRVEDDQFFGIDDLERVLPLRPEAIEAEEEKSLSLEESEELEVLLTQTLHILRGCDVVARRISASLDRVSDKTKDVSVAYRELLTP